MREFTTMEKLAEEVSAQYGAVLKIGEHCIVADMKYNGCYVEVYEFVDSLSEFDDTEARLSLIWSKEEFEDNGDAVKAGFAYLAR